VSGQGLAAIGVLAVIALGGGALALKLFWPARAAEPAESDPWAQHNESRMPSLERAPEARGTSVDAAVAAQVMGD
jgi:hypothetical protein